MKLLMSFRVNETVLGKDLSIFKVTLERLKYVQTKSIVRSCKRVFSIYTIKNINILCTKRSLWQNNIVAGEIT